MIAQHLTVYAYQELLDVGWRRSGTYIYHADPNGTCCPAYTIRLDATQFTPTATHRRVLRRFESFCSGDWARRQRAQQSHGHDSAPSSPHGPASEPDNGKRHAEAGSTQQHASSPGREALAVQQQVADRCSQAVANRIQSSSQPALVAALATSNSVFTVQQAPEATANTDSHSASHTLCLRSALCWKAAAQAAHATVHVPAAPTPPAQWSRPQTSTALSPTPPLSKNKAKKARKAAAKAAAAAGTAAGLTVVALATKMAAEALPLVHAALTADVAVAALAPAVSAARGHLSVTLQLPAAVPSGGSPELKTLLQPHAPASPLPGGAATQPSARAEPRVAGEAVSDAAAEPRSETATGGESGESADSGAEWSPQSSKATSEASGGGADAERLKWWLADPPDGGWKLRMVLRPSEFVEEEYQLYQRYQCAVHKDPPGKISRKGFHRFLVDTPWQGTVSAGEDSDAPECGYGTFHMQYWLGDHLIAVGVWDVLPRCAARPPAYVPRRAHACDRWGVGPAGHHSGTVARRQ